MSESLIGQETHMHAAASAENTAELARQNVSFRFVLAEHTIANSANIAQSLEGCDTVVFERFGLPPEIRQLAEQSLTLALSPDADPAMKQDVLNNMAALSPYIAATVAQLPPSVRRVRLFDVDSDSPGSRAAAAFKKNLESWEKAVDANAPNEELRGHYMGVVMAGAASSAVREPYMSQQLDAIANQVAVDGDNHIVGVVNGAAHDAVVGLTADKGYATETVLQTAENPFAPGTPAKLDYVAENMHRLKDGDQGVMTPELADRAIILTTAVKHGYDHTAARTLIGLMGPGEVADLADALDAIKASHQGPELAAALDKKIGEELVKYTARAIAIGGVAAAFDGRVADKQ